ncbi:MAG: uracil phosphoribosyltransferase [Elusimicrobia bacterium]|nr:uracil phosphoribosyltransferase [Elusimicrobiota bacterium]
MTAASRLILCSHPLVQEALAGLRDKATPPERFRALLDTASTVMGVEALAALKTRAASVQTPLKAAPVKVLDQPVVLAAVLRAGLGLLPGLLRLVPQARVGHIGLYRNEETLNPVRYYVRLPKDLDRSFVILLDPMLATGGSAVEALRILKTDGAAQITLLSLLAAKAGVRRVQREHPDVTIVTAAVDSVLNRHGYIVPGLGDAGDRLFGTF